MSPAEFDLREEALRELPWALARFVSLAGSAGADHHGPISLSVTDRAAFHAWCDVLHGHVTVNRVGSRPFLVLQCTVGQFAVTVVGPFETEDETT